jgi:hypothetical protein
MQAQQQLERGAQCWPRVCRSSPRTKDVSSGAWQPVQTSFTERYHDVMHICTWIHALQSACHFTTLATTRCWWETIHHKACFIGLLSTTLSMLCVLVHPLEHIWAVMCTADAMAAAIKVWSRALQQDCPTGTSATCDQRNVPDGCPCANSSSVLLPLLSAFIHSFLQHIDFISTIRF